MTSPIDRVGRLWSIGLLALMASTFALWLPPAWTGTSAYPRVAAAPWLAPVQFLDFVFATAVVVAAIMLWFRKTARAGWLGIAIGMSVLMALDQHRTQPWVYQSVLLAVIACLTPTRSTRPPMRSALTGWRILTISIYAYSAIGKLDFQFLHTVGQNFLGTTAGLAGIDVTTWPKSARIAAAAIFPITELLIAALLAFPRTRRIGGVAAIGMHVSLIGLLSPWVLGHSAGVLTWNALLAAQAWVLFATLDPAAITNEPAITADTPASPPRSGAAIAVWVGIALVMPLTERAGWWDHWWSWALYSPHSSRFEMFIAQSQRSRWPEPVQRATQPDDDADGWCEVSLGRLSLDVRGVPVVPQARYQIQLADQLARSVPADLAVSGKLQTAADRWDGTRQETFLFNRGEIANQAISFWLHP